MQISAKLVGAFSFYILIKNELIVYNILVYIMKKNIIILAVLIIILISGSIIFYNRKNVKSSQEENNIVINNSPVISILGEGTLEMCPNEEYVEKGYIAFDKNDGNITDEVKVIEQENQILYYVENSLKSKSFAKRKIVRKDSDKPTIELYGNQVMTLYLGEEYIEKGFKASDNCDGDLTDKVVVSGNVDTTKEGTYKITYKVKDKSGNEDYIERYIDILKEPDFKSKTIYLTFDDGPSNTTPKILDILKEENVKATFFVINSNDKNNKYIKRAFAEGHTIGLHSYSHKYKDIYKSEKAYFNDLNLIEEKIEQIIDIKPNIIRFPGGSSNTISSKGLMKKLSVETKKQGYIYFDWNIASYDTSNISSKKIYNRVISQLKKYNYNTNIILMHDFANNKKTVNALKKIIEYGKKEGYRFDKITEWTPQIKHHISN